MTRLCHKHPTLRSKAQSLNLSTSLRVAFFLHEFYTFVIFSDSEGEGEELAQPEFRGLWEEDVHKVSLESISLSVKCLLQYNYAVLANFGVFRRQISAR